MANPGPASATTNHPQGLNSNQALRLIASYQGANIAATGDTVLPVLNTGRYSVKNVVVTNASADISGASVGLFTQSGGAGTAIVSNAALTGVTTSTVVSERTVASTAAATGQSLYFRVGTAASSGTADVFVYGYDLTFLP